MQEELSKNNQSNNAQDVNGPISSKQKDLSKESRGENGRNQVVMNFTHQDWVTLVRKLEIKSAMITV